MRREALTPRSRARTLPGGAAQIHPTVTGWARVGARHAAALHELRRRAGAAATGARSRRLEMGDDEPHAACYATVFIMERPMQTRRRR